MEFRIADTFTDSLAKLRGNEQKAVKTTAFDLQLDPVNPGMSFHKLDRAKDPNFWSVRVSRDLRIIVHRAGSSLLLCYVDHHDAAYHWAERRKIERHPRTGAAQIVEIREAVREIVIPRYVPEEPAEAPKPALFAESSEDKLLSYGVPPEWLADVRAATEDTLFDLAEHLPQEAAEALLDLATGTEPRVSAAAAPESDPFEHPDAQRRFRILDNVEELERALEYPWEKWSIFLHPEQRQLVEHDFNGPARVAGSAGTGKTVVALHRAAHLARDRSEARILLTTFSDTLATALRSKLHRLIGSQPRLAERLEVHSLGAIARRLYKRNLGPFEIAAEDTVQELITAAATREKETRFTPRFLQSEWQHTVDAWQLTTWEEYRDVQRLGRKRRLSEGQREGAWNIFQQVRGDLDERRLVTEAQLYTQLAGHLRSARHSPFEHTIIDEAQDVSVAQLRFLAALGGGRPDSLFFAGDLGQRIFQQPFSWKSLGVDVRGRSRTLRVNYRTSHQIRTQADRLLGPELHDVDGITESRRGTISVFNGPPPNIEVLASSEDEARVVADWITDRLTEGIAPHEIAIFVRSDAQLPRARDATERTTLPTVELTQTLDTKRDHLSLSTMHRAKGLEFRCVAVMACDDEVIPLQARIETAAEDSDLEEIYDSERHLLYVACTRARDNLLVSGVEPGSEFLEDLMSRPGKSQR